MRGIRLIRLMIGLLDSHCECGVKPPGLLNHEVSLIIILTLEIGGL